MLTKFDLATIHAIADRTAVLFTSLGVVPDDQAKYIKSITACELAIVHEEVVPLRLAELLAADDRNFAHDIGGIHRHLDTGRGSRKAELKDCFLPRFAKV